MTGIDVILYEKTQTGTDAFGQAIYTVLPHTISNVLVAPVSATEALETINLTGRKIVYQLGIPKGDTHDWKEGNKVTIRGKDYRIFGIPTEGIDHLIPLAWNKKVTVEAYE